MRKSQEQEEALARSRAELIIQVQAGRLSASAAAARMGVSRKTYYKWERRGLSGIVAGLKEGEPGRRARRRDPEKEDLRQEVERLQKQLEVQEQLRRVREVFQAGPENKSTGTATKKKGGADGDDPEHHG
ncbi:MAG: helix-turn-helix domain-containing protein [Desulfobaccales bacterium]